MTKYTDDDSSSAVAFVYCSYKLQQEQTTLNLLSSVLRQLVVPFDQLPGRAHERCSRLVAARARRARPGLQV